MAALTLRTVKGSPLTNSELDANFTALNTELGQKLVASSNLSDLTNAASARTNLGLGNVENKSSATIRSELTSLNVTTALGFTPYNATNPSGYITSAALSPYLTSATAASTYQTTLVSGTSIKTVNGQSVLGPGNIQIDGGVTSFNTRTGAVTLSSSDVTTALGFTPLSNATSYLPLVGGTVSGILSLTGTNATPLEIIRTGSSANANMRFSNTASTTFFGIGAQSGELRVGTTVDIYNTGNIVLHTGNVGSYAPSLTGAGASGSWGINVTGSAGSVAWTNVTGRPTAVSSFTNDSGYITTNGTARTIVENNGTIVGTRRALNFIPGTGISLSISDDAANEEVDITITSTVTGGVTSFNTRTGAVSLTSGDVTGALGYTPVSASGGSSITGSGSFRAFSIRSTDNATNWSWFALGGSSDSAGNVWHIATNGAATDIGAAGALHIRGANGSLTSLALNQDHSVRFRSTDVQLNGNQVLHAGNAPRARNSDLMYYAGFTLDANSMPTSSSGFTYSVNAPWTGPIVQTGTGGGYDMQINGQYSGHEFSIRSRNGDVGTWMPWKRILTDYNYTTWTVARSGDSMSGRLTLPAWTTTGRNYSNEWIEFGNYTGLYSPLNGAHFYPNDGTYGAWEIQGSRNGWQGLEFGNHTTLMMNDGAYGFHRNGSGWRFYVEGTSGFFPGNVTAYWSDERLKENLRKIDREALAILGQMDAFRFNWNSKVAELGDAIPVGKEEIGLIAQRVQRALPDAVVINKAGAKVGDKDFDYLTINYDRITPLLVEATNIHEDDITELKAKVQQLEALVAKLIGA